VAEYAGLYILETITTVRRDMHTQQMIEHLENSVYGLKARALDQSEGKGYFSALISKVKSTISPKSSVSVLFRTVDSEKIKEINVHDLFALLRSMLRGSPIVIRIATQTCLDTLREQ